MSHKKITSFLLGLSVTGFLVGIILTEPVIFRLCNPEERFGCIDSLDVIGQPLGLLSIALAIIFFLLLFLSELYFKAWLKYAVWFIPVAVLWIMTASDGCGGFLTLCFDKELATWWSSGIYVVLSLVVFIATYLKRRKELAQV